MPHTEERKKWQEWRNKMDELDRLEEEKYRPTESRNPKVLTVVFVVMLIAIMLVSMCMSLDILKDLLFGL